MVTLIKMKKMKNLINKSIVLGLLLSVFSCTELKEEPVGLLAPEAFFKTASDVDGALKKAKIDKIRSQLKSIISKFRKKK